MIARVVIVFLLVLFVVAPLSRLVEGKYLSWVVLAIGAALAVAISDAITRRRG